MMLPLVHLIIAVVVICVLAYVSKYVIDAFFPEPIRWPVLLLVGVLLLVAVLWLIAAQVGVPLR